MKNNLKLLIILVTTLTLSIDLSAMPPKRLKGKARTAARKEQKAAEATKLLTSIQGIRGCLAEAKSNLSEATDSFALFEQSLSAVDKIEEDEKKSIADFTHEVETKLKRLERHLNLGLHREFYENEIRKEFDGETPTACANEAAFSELIGKLARAFYKAHLPIFSFVEEKPADLANTEIQEMWIACHRESELILLEKVEQALTQMGLAPRA